MKRRSLRPVDETVHHVTPAVFEVEGLGEHLLYPVEQLARASEFLEGRRQGIASASRGIRDGDNAFRHEDRGYPHAHDVPFHAPATQKSETHRRGLEAAVNAD
jgi:hypothetical protein